MRTGSGSAGRRCWTTFPPRRCRRGRTPSPPIVPPGGRLRAPTRRAVPRRIDREPPDRSPAGRRLPRRLRLLLEVPDPLQGRAVDDVRDRAVRPLLAVAARGLPPAGRGDAALLAEQRGEDLRLLGAEPGQGG